MKKFFVFASLALLVAGSALAQSPSTLNANRLVVAPNATGTATLLPGAAGAAGFLATGPTTTNNDDSCDIATVPAATLLLPFFEVDFRSPAASAVNTNFNLTNVSPRPAIAHITIWTDWSFPVIDFNIYLTGYDVQGVSLYDIISRGVIPPTGYNPSREGALSTRFVTARNSAGNATTFDRNANPNFATSVVPSCANLPGPIPTSLLRDIQNALTTGQYSGCTGRVGGTNANAVGYVTVDVANSCTQSLPTTPEYFAQEILFDNVLIGDYQRINPTATTGNYAGGNPMVHIRAIPEGGPNFATVGDAGGVPRGTQTNFPFTFYDRYTGTGTGADVAFGRETDRRQPLPGVFAARYIEGGAGGFNTNLAMWREGLVGGGTAAENVDCSDASLAPGNDGLSQFVLNAAIPITRIVRFDESENPSLSQGCQISPCPAETDFAAPETSNPSTTDDTAFPGDNSATTDAGGWLYLNLNNGLTDAETAPALTSRTNGESQNWVVIQQTAEGRYGIDFDAAYLGNGCSPNPGETAVIGPLPNFTIHEQ